jgi:hypothetical protein
MIFIYKPPLFYHNVPTCNLPLLYYTMIDREREFCKPKCQENPRVRIWSTVSSPTEFVKTYINRKKNDDNEDHWIALAVVSREDCQSFES